MRSLILLFGLTLAAVSTTIALPVVPCPQEVKELSGVVDLASTEEIIYSPANDQSVRGCALELQRTLRRLAGRELPITESAGNEFRIAVRTSKCAPAAPAGVVKPEGYALTVSQGVSVKALDLRGICYAVRTLKQLITACGSRLPACRIRDWPDMPHRAVMIDMARLKERHEYYYDLIDFLAERKINVVYLHFTDDGNCALEYNSRPEITTPYAFTQAQMKNLIEFAAQRQVELIPEIESWGHASYILQHGKYAHLREGKAGTLCTLKPETWEVLDDLYRETAALFPSKYMHIGCDEANFGQCDECKAFIEKNGKAALVGKQLAAACELAKKYGKTPVLWGDVLLRFRESADVVPKDAVISYWNYKSDVSPEPAQFLTSKGFTVVGCPALVCGGRMILPHGDCLENIANFSKIVRDQKLVGMSTTVWVPQRYICDSPWYGLAYAAEMSWSGSRHKESAFTKALLKEFYGIDATPEMIRQTRTAHYLGLNVSSLFTNLWNYRGQFDKLSKPELLRHTVPHRDKARICVQTLKKFQPKAMRHQEEYEAFLLAAEVIEHAAERAASAGELHGLLARARSGDRQALSQAISLLDAHIARHTELNERLSSFWDRRRYPSHPGKYGGGQNLLGTFANTTDYIKLISARLKDLEAGKSADWEGVLAEPEGGSKL